jgi:hypothetical protein
MLLGLASGSCISEPVNSFYTVFGPKALSVVALWAYWCGSVLIKLWCVHRVGACLLWWSWHKFASPTRNLLFNVIVVWAVNCRAYLFGWNLFNPLIFKKGSWKCPELSIVLLNIGSRIDKKLSSHFKWKYRLLFILKSHPSPGRFKLKVFGVLNIL